MTRVLVVDGDPFFRRGLCESLVEQRMTCAVVGDLGTARVEIRAWAPDVIISDVSLPSVPGGVGWTRNTQGLALAREAKRIAPGIGFILLTAFDQHWLEFRDLIEQGWRGLAYCVKGVDPPALMTAIRQVMAGHIDMAAAVGVAPDPLVQALSNQLTPDEKPWVERAVHAIPTLTPQEHRALRLLAASHNLTGIAQQLAICRADKLIGRVYVKLGLHELAERSHRLRQSALAVKACQINHLVRGGQGGLRDVQLVRAS